MVELSVIIPVYNEEKNISLVYDRCITVAQKICSSFEIIFVNDGKIGRAHV